jgi:hypothetical protein
MAATPTTQCPKCQADVLMVRLAIAPHFTIAVDAAPDPTGHVVETASGAARVLKLDRSDAAGGTIYRAHHITCGAEP